MREHSHGAARCVHASILIGGLMLAAFGCGGGDSQAPAAAPALPAGPAPMGLAEVQEFLSVEIAHDARTVEEAYPHLTAAGLVSARLIDMPEGTLLACGQTVIRQADVDADIERAPEQMRAQLRKNAFFVLEQMATGRLLEQEARAAGATGADQNALLQSYLGTLVAAAQVSDEEVSRFYAENPDLVGGAPMASVGPQIRQFLLQQKQQALVEEHLRGMGERAQIAVSAAWVARHAALARDNVVDRARESGMPTLASFGADTCIPCQQMAPTRDALAKKYQGRVNVVYVHVGQEQILASRFGIQGIPHLIFFDKDGREVMSHTGFMTQNDIEAKFTQMGIR